MSPRTLIQPPFPERHAARLTHATCCLAADLLADNPYDMMSQGCDFLRNHSSPSIDFATIHLWPDSWLAQATDEKRLHFARRWINCHVDVCQQRLNKPLVVAEFGWKPDGRAAYFDKVNLACKSPCHPACQPAQAVLCNLCHRTCEHNLTKLQFRGIAAGLCAIWRSFVPTASIKGPYHTTESQAGQQHRHCKTNDCGTVLQLLLLLCPSHADALLLYMALQGYAAHCKVCAWDAAGVRANIQSC